MRYQRKRYATHRYDSHYHCDVHKAVEEEIAGNAKCDKPAILVLTTQSYQQCSPGN